MPLHEDRDEATGSKGRGSGLYVHLPFCSAICPYCDFSVLTGSDDRRRRFVAHLAKEIDLWGDHWDGPSFDTVYLGGGTPSLLDRDELASLLDRAFERLPVAADAWLSIEANPEDVDAESLRAWKDLGIRTLSLGVQSFDDNRLRYLGRRHDGATARRTGELALEAGFDTVSFDLIYGLPDDGPRVWARDLRIATALDPPHLSCYQLTVHRGTPFGFRRDRGELSELGDDLQHRLFVQTHETLADSGLPAYEVSSFARSSAHRSRHNQKYWHHLPYLGLGPSAHSYAEERRWWNIRKVPPYERRLAEGERPVEGEERLSPRRRADESLMFGFRRSEGIDLATFRERHGIDLATRNRALVARLLDEGLVELVDGRLRPTLDGLAVAEALATAFEVGHG